MGAGRRLRRRDFTVVKVLPLPLPRRRLQARDLPGYSTLRYELKTATSVINTILTSSQSDQFCT